ncbi:MAG: HoxN/HupN/NixA family nickel/cobalt transporter [Candidatus Eremiobacteraeota bacterium]|nr:HoxN/HupN/NixA family nickel/cobalt transporter [Candidatus Eremiobacteraeota bacterium]
MQSSFGISAVLRVFNDSAGDIRSKVIGIYAFLVTLNVAAWALSFAAFAHHPLLLGTALLAYTFGLRHSVDADHISAIDNVTRKLMQEGKRPVAVGFFFSLGHSTIVVALSVGIAIAAAVVKNSIPSLQNLGGLIGTSVSAAFLFVIAIINMLVLWDIFRTFQTVKRGGEYNDRTLEEFLSQRGLMGRFFKPLLRLVRTSWHMYPIGLLFGLGFDTATEVGLLGIAAVEAGKGLPIYYILLFPLLFTAGMCLIDTTDGILMLGAYGWAFVKPIRKLYYNMNITLVSVLVALVVGGIEALSIVTGQLRLQGPMWSVVGNLSGNFGTLGFIIIGIFIASWAVSTVIYKIKRYDEIDVALAPPPERISAATTDL